MIYIITAFILLFMLLVFIFLFILRVNVKINYEFIEFNKIKLNIQVILFNKSIYKFSSNNSLTEIIIVYFNKDKKQEVTLKDSFADTKKYISRIMSDISKEKIHINIFVSSSNAIFTVYLSTLVSTLFSIYLAKHINSKYIDNIKYIVTPNYTTNFVIFNVNINTRVITVIRIFFQITRRKINGKSSNRKSNVNSND